MGQFAVDLVHELKRKETNERQRSRYRLSRGNNSNGDGSIMIELGGVGDTEEEEEHMQSHWNERLNALLASAQSCVLRRQASCGFSQLGTRQPGGEDTGSTQKSSRETPAGQNVQISVRIRDRSSRHPHEMGGSGAASMSADANAERRARSGGSRGVEELLADVEVVPDMPFPVTLFFDPVSVTSQKGQRGTAAFF